MFADLLFARKGATAQTRQEPNAIAHASAPAALLVLGALALAGIVLAWNNGQLPEREEDSAPLSGKASIAPDLALYRDIIAEVRAGKNYYVVARQRIPRYGFPIASPLNWRLPTYAWVLSRLPGPKWIQATLVLLSMIAVGLAFVAQARTSGVGFAAVTAFLLFGVVRWSIDGQAYLAQEPWAATLILISLGAHSLGARHVSWRALAIVAGIAALLFRELALPYCAVAFVLAMWNRRWREAAGWGVGIALFFGFFAWHVGQVKAQLAGTEVGASAGIAQWLRFGGLDFVLLTTRMNSLLFAAPGWLLWLYLLVSLVGLSHNRDETSRLACLAALAYLLAFAVLGRPENFYWGLMAAPLLAWGTAHGPSAISDLWKACRGGGLVLPTADRVLS